MARIFVGVSEYRNLAGKSQYSEERAGLQLLATLAEVRAEGYTVTINEADRPRPDQTAFWNDMVRRGAPPAVVAARPFTSKHDGKGRGESLAFDLGGPGGSVISNAAHASVKRNGAKYGIHHIGAGFNPPEKWHFEYVPGTATKMASAGPTQQEIEEEQMTAQLYRHQKTGNYAVMDMSTGRVWPLAGADYVGQLQAMKQVPNTPPIIMTPEQWDFLLDRCKEARLQIAEQVWVHPILGVDGSVQLSGLRISAAQVDAYKAATRKIDAAALNEDSIVARVTQAVKTMFTNGGK